MSSLREVAQRIQERNNALATEQATFELLRDQLELAKNQLKSDQLATQSVRKGLLTAVRSRHGVELDCLALTEETTKIAEETSTLQSSIEAIRNKSSDLHRKFNEEQAPLYSTHTVSTTLHTRASESLLIRAQRKKSKREEKIHHLKSEGERQRVEVERMKDEMGRIRDMLDELDRREEEEDEEMVGVTMQIRQILAKVSYDCSILLNRM
jgi:chromosome segregation ATPase